MPISNPTIVGLVSTIEASMPTFKSRQVLYVGLLSLSGNLHLSIGIE